MEELWWEDEWSGTEHHVTRLSWESRAKSGEEWEDHEAVAILPLLRRILAPQAAAAVSGPESGAAPAEHQPDLNMPDLRDRLGTLEADKVAFRLLALALADVTLQHTSCEGCRRLAQRLLAAGEALGLHWRSHGQPGT